MHAVYEPPLGHPLSFISFLGSCDHGLFTVHTCGGTGINISWFSFTVLCVALPVSERSQLLSLVQDIMKTRAEGVCRLLSVLCLTFWLQIAVQQCACGGNCLTTSSLDRKAPHYWHATKRIFQFVAFFIPYY